VSLQRFAFTTEARFNTRLLGEMHEDLGQKLDILRVQNDLERLDREWAIQSGSAFWPGSEG
jgi:hypothetical protein